MTLARADRDLGAGAAALGGWVASGGEVALQASCSGTLQPGSQLRVGLPEIGAAT